MRRSPDLTRVCFCLSLLLLLNLPADANAETSGSPPKKARSAKRAAIRPQVEAESLDQQIARLETRLDKMIAESRGQDGGAEGSLNERSNPGPEHVGETQAEMAPREETAGKEPSQPAEGKQRPLQTLIYGATPEERERLKEERKRLSASAASFGTDPTAIIGYYQLAYQRFEYKTNAHLDLGAAAVQVPITPNWLLRVTVPYAWLDVNGPRGITTNGMSDMVVRTGFRLFANDSVALLVGGDASFPTAANKQLGTGKYTVGPGGAISVPLARLQSLFLTVVQDFNSVGGDPSRNNIHYMQVQTTINTIWTERWWTSGIMTWNMDWNNNRKTTMNLQGEIGHQFDRHWNVFVGGGGGVVGQGTVFGFDWTALAGVRWVMTGALFGEKVFKELPMQ